MHGFFMSSALPHRFELVKIHAIPNIWECTNSQNKEIAFGKPYHSQAVSF